MPSILIETTLGRTVRNSFGIVLGALVAALFSFMIIPTGIINTSYATRGVVCCLAIFILTTAVAYKFTNMVAKKYFMAVLAISLLYAVIQQGMFFKYSFAILYPQFLIADCGFLVRLCCLVSFPRCEERLCILMFWSVLCSVQ